MTTGQQIALLIFLALAVGAGIVLREFLFGTYSRWIGRENRAHLMIAIFVFMFGGILLATLFK